MSVLIFLPELMRRDRDRQIEITESDPIILIGVIGVPTIEQKLADQSSVCISVSTLHF
jgi:hypothetical protein